MIWFIWFFRTSTIPSSTLRHLPKESEKKKRGEIQPGNPGRPKGRGRIGKLGFSPWPSPRSSSLSSKNPFFPLSLPSCPHLASPTKRSRPLALIRLPHSRVSLPFFPQIESPHCRPSKQSLPTHPTRLQDGAGDPAEGEGGGGGRIINVSAVLRAALVAARRHHAPVARHPAHRHLGHHPAAPPGRLPLRGHLPAPRLRLRPPPHPLLV